ncbi:nucleotide exchange factor GrpE [uncultured Desulfobulbus sp.]|uniref:nucleotide exchange factor GrpE n=1 Tax=uncultured Desulfobulbus sp. TaxID=239745 RepID=UPI0029C9488B|nr:nucleotide exchange factor GrpE [uncultured Desulfobulbus sp.]
MVDEVKEQGLAGEQQSKEVPEDLGIVETLAEAGEQQGTEVEILQREMGETRDQLMRVAAEFDNFKKRMEREKSKLLKYAGENILRDLLVTLDNLDRAVEQGNAAVVDDTKKLESMLQGVELTRKGLVATLERYGVEPLTAVGLTFNPDEHDALTMEASEEVPANHVLREFAKGYRFRDRVLRHAQVVVSSGPAKVS